MTSGDRLILAALSFYGEAEAPGSASNAKILSWIKKFFRASATDDSTTPWCGIFMSQVFGTCGFPTPSVPARASSWAEVGIPIPLTEEMKPGDVLVFDREGGNHVTLFVSAQGELIHCLGGNQGNRVSIASYNRSKLKHVRRIRTTVSSS
jgi:uncharacterized protein (TIGR02594 family)